MRFHICVNVWYHCTFVAVGVHGTDPVLRTIHVLFKVIPGATQLPSAYVASPTNCPSQTLQTIDKHITLNLSPRKAKIPA